MYNISDVLSDREKEILKKNKISFDVEINTDKDMRDYISIIFDNVAGYKNIQDISDLIVKYHNKIKKETE